MFFKLAILSIFLVFSQVSFSQSSCYDVAIKNVIERYEDDKSVIYVQFDEEINGKLTHQLINQQCSRFYDSFICDYRSETLKGWEISSDSDITTTWFINYCID